MQVKSITPSKQILEGVYNKEGRILLYEKQSIKGRIITVGKAKHVMKIISGHSNHAVLANGRRGERCSGAADRGAADGKYIIGIIIDNTDLCIVSGEIAWLD